MTRRHPGKEAGIVVDFVHPATTHDDPVVTLPRSRPRDATAAARLSSVPFAADVGAASVSSAASIPVTPDHERRSQIFEREPWRIAVEHLDGGEQRCRGRCLRPRRAQRLAPRAGNAPTRPHRLTPAPLPAHRRRAQSHTRSCASGRCRKIAAAKDAEAFDLSIDVHWHDHAQPDAAAVAAARAPVCAARTRRRRHARAARSPPTCRVLEARHGTRGWQATRAAIERLHDVRR